MKAIYQVILAFILVVFIISCQSNTDVKQLLANASTRTAIMDSISSNSEMSKEMMSVLMKNKDCSKMMMENHASMMKMMKDDPAMMKDMMSGMMDCCKNDTAKMSAMCKSMMSNPEMMSCMHKMNGDDMDMKKMSHSKHH